MKTIAEEKAQELVKTGVIKPSQVKTFVMAYNLACREIVDIFNEDYIKEMVSDKAECYALGNPITIHADGAYKGYKEGIKDTIMQIKYYLKDDPDIEPEIETNEAFEADFKEYEKENPKYREYLTDSTYFELMDWYDLTHETKTEKDEDGDIVCASDEAHEFGKYVWVKIFGLEW